jgi:hypothetical protein
MKRLWAGAAIVLCATLLPAAGALAQAAAPFPEVELPPAPHHSHRLANAAIVSGVALIAASFVFVHEADQTYSQYLAAIDPDQITSLYDRTVRFDHLSSGSLIAGNVLLATGLTARFIVHQNPAPVSLVVSQNRCAIACSF